MRDEPAVHGDPDVEELERLGVDPSRLLDLSVNVSPFGPHPEVLRAIREASVDRYPDRRCVAARRALAAAIEVEPARLVLGNGAAELLWTAIGALGDAERPLLIVGPTFGEPAAAALAQRVPIARVDAAEHDAFALDVARIDAAIGRLRPALVYLCHPNNPTGRAMPPEHLDALVRAHPATRFLLDQAFLSLSERHQEAGLRFPENVLVLRSMTKDHALAGVRIAYAIASADDARRIERARPPWTISAIAQAALIEALRHPEQVVRARTRLLEARRELEAALVARGLAVVPSETFYLLVRTGAADALRAALLARHAIAVRSCTSFGLPEHLRIAARDGDAQARLLAALDQERPR